jgi:hypothetical protein
MLGNWEYLVMGSDLCMDPLVFQHVCVPCVKVPQHPRVGVTPPGLVAAKVSVHNVDLRHTHCQPAEGKQENLLWVYSITTGIPIIEVTGKKCELVIHRLELAIEIKCGVETLQLAPVESRHFQCGHVRKIVNPKALSAGKLQRCSHLLRWDVEEDVVDLSNGVEKTEKSSENDGQGVDGCIDHIVTEFPLVHHALGGQDERKKLCCCRYECRYCQESDLDGRLQVHLRRTKMNPSSVCRVTTLGDSSTKLCLLAALWGM